MAFKKKNGRNLSVLTFFIFLWMTEAKLSQDNKTHLPEPKSSPKLSDGASLVFADEFKVTLERYLFGICPQSFKFRWSQMAVTVKGKNTTTVGCDLDTDQQDLAGRLATLALRAHSAARSDCSRLGAALANTLGELARTAANRHAMSAAVNEANKKRKLSKSQKAKIQAKQRTALAVKKKAAAAAAAAAAKMAS
ncbi:PREDICTED: uncharacterized protein LOC106107068 isoform X2 [Papilio polytes]|uniref:uncharacterized protein LOC106107068 isoform X2 n=1 Tax=Papilio polytes TaxID=76194 RepID=UPI000675DA7C|nr:PREDICTED: uncharacterized protein LOC106107068 isoform X2 [Papilio polytes]